MPKRHAQPIKTFMVNIADSSKLITTIPRDEFENTLLQLQSATVSIQGVGNGLRHGDVFTLYGQHAINVENAYTTGPSPILVKIPNPPPPEVNFVINSVKVPIGIPFDSVKDTSLNNPTNWYWEVSGPETIYSNDQYPIFNFTKPGLYQISLTVSNNTGVSTKHSSDTIEVYRKNLINYTINTTPPGENSNFTQIRVQLGTGKLSEPVNVTISNNGANGQFYPSNVITLTDDVRTAVVDYVSLEAGDVTFIADSNNLLIDPDDVTVTFMIGQVTEYTMQVTPHAQYADVATIEVALGEGSLIGSTSITFNDNNNGGVFTPSFVVLDSETRSEYVTYRAVITGQITIDSTCSLPLTNPNAVELQFAFNALNATFYGAVGDNMTDNKLAIEAGLAAAVATNKSLRFSDGIYCVNLSNVTPNTTNRITIYNDVEIVGNSKTVSQIRFNPGETDNYSWCGFYMSPARKFTVRNMTLQGPAVGTNLNSSIICRSGTTTSANYNGFIKLDRVNFVGMHGNCIYDNAGTTNAWTGTVGIDLTDCVITALYNGIYGSGIGYTNKDTAILYVKAVNTTWDTCGRNYTSPNGYGIWHHSGCSVDLLNCNFMNCLYGGIKSSNLAGKNPTYYKINSCTFTNNSLYDLITINSSPVLFEINGCTFNSSVQYNLVLNTSTILRDCTFNGAVQNLILMDVISDFTPNYNDFHITMEDCTLNNFYLNIVNCHTARTFTARRCVFQGVATHVAIVELTAGPTILGVVTFEECDFLSTASNSIKCGANMVISNCHFTGNQFNNIMMNSSVVNVNLVENTFDRTGKTGNILRYSSAIPAVSSQLSGYGNTYIIGNSNVYFNELNGSAITPSNSLWRPRVLLEGELNTQIPSKATLSLELSVGTLSVPVTVNFADNNNNGTFTPITVQLQNTSRNFTVNYDAQQSGTVPLSIDTGGELVVTGPVSFDFVVQDVSTYDITSDIDVQATNTCMFVVDLGVGDVSSPVTFTMSDSGLGGSFSPSNAVILNSQNRSATITYTSIVSGTVPFTISNNASLTGPASINKVFSLANCNGYVLSATPYTGNMDDYTVTVALGAGVLAAPVTITLSDAGDGGQFSPSSQVVLSHTIRTATVRYTLKETKQVTISATNNGSLTNGSSVTIQIHPDTLNVLWYGAIGDDTTNDKPSFQTAISAAISQGNLCLFRIGLTASCSLQPHLGPQT